jgi:hypothetical protein
MTLQGQKQPLPLDDLRDRCAYLSDFVLCLRDFESRAKKHKYLPTYIEHLERQFSDELLRCITELDIREAELEAKAEIDARLRDEIASRNESEIN